MESVCVWMWSMVQILPLPQSWKLSSTQKNFDCPNQLWMSLHCGWFHQSLVWSFLTEPHVCLNWMLVYNTLFAEVQLKPNHKPIKVYNEWSQLVKKFTKQDISLGCPEPTLHLRRNAFYHKNDEMRLRDPGIIELLYCEAKHNVLVGRYPCDLSETFLLGSLVARINLGNFVPQQHTPMFFRYGHLSNRS